MLLIAACEAAFMLLAYRAANGGGIASELPSWQSCALLAVGTALQAGIVCRSGSVDVAVLTVALCAANVCAATDAATGYIFDAVTLPACALSALVAALHGSLPATLLGMAVASGTLFALYAVTRGRGLGFGDVKLAACIGAALGAGAAMTSLFVSFVAGGAHAAFLLASGRGKRGDALPFGPYLAAGAFLVASLGRLG